MQGLILGGGACLASAPSVWLETTVGTAALDSFCRDNEVKSCAYRGQQPQALGNLKPAESADLPSASALQRGAARHADGSAPLSWTCISAFCQAPQNVTLQHSIVRLSEAAQLALAQGVMQMPSVPHQLCPLASPSACPAGGHLKAISSSAAFQACPSIPAVLHARQAPVSPAVLHAKQAPVSPAVLCSRQAPVFPAVLCCRQAPVSPAVLHARQAPVSPPLLHSRQAPVFPAVLCSRQAPVFQQCCAPGRSQCVSSSAVFQTGHSISHLGPASPPPPSPPRMSFSRSSEEASVAVLLATALGAFLNMLCRRWRWRGSGSAAAFLPAGAAGQQLAICAASQTAPSQKHDSTCLGCCTASACSQCFRADGLRFRADEVCSTALCHLLVHSAARFAIAALSCVPTVLGNPAPAQAPLLQHYRLLLCVLPTASPWPATGRLQCCCCCSRPSWLPWTGQPTAALPAPCAHPLGSLKLPLQPHLPRHRVPLCASC